MGNSITEFWQYSDPEFFKNKPYVDRAISGQTSPQNLLRFRQDVINLKPTVVVLMIGINDIAENTGTYNEDNTMNHIAAMAEMARGNGVRMVLSSVMPAFDFPWRPGMGPAQKVISLNKRIKAYADKQGLEYVDYHSAMADERQGLPQKYSEDGVHPNLAGYKIMEPLVEKAIAGALKRKP
jgi:lysophospholipase L1-like esterase